MSGRFDERIDLPVRVDNILYMLLHPYFGPLTFAAMEIFEIAWDQSVDMLVQHALREAHHATREAANG